MAARRPARRRSRRRSRRGLRRFGAVVLAAVLGLLVAGAAAEVIPAGVIGLVFVLVIAGAVLAR
jgi:uncharacterized membrane protein